MKVIKKLILLLLILSNYDGKAQIGFGIIGGFQQSIPIVMRDTFSGKPSLGAGINIYLPINKKLKFATGLSYKQVAVNYKAVASSLSWQTVNFNLGTEWASPKFINSLFYTGFNTNYILGFGKNNLSASSNTGNAYKSIDIKQKIIPSIELGLIFRPRPFINIHVSTIQPIPQTTKENKLTLPGTINFGIEYRLTTQDIKNWNNDKTPSAEKVFTENLKEGTLYFIEDGTDSSQKLFKKIINEYYHFSKVDFIKVADLSKTLESFSLLPNANQIFIAKIGAIVYDINRASTQGLIIYDYTMQNPIVDNPFFIRNITGDSLFEDPLVNKKLIKTLNNKLFKIYNLYKK